MVNFFGLIFGDRIEFFIEKIQFGKNELIYYDQSSYQRIEFTRKNDGKIKFFLNGSHQFESGEWEEVYHETFAHPAFSFIGGEKPLKVLILGGGDGLLLREIIKYPQAESIILVDIDREVIDASKNLGFMRGINRGSFLDSRVRVVIGDAFKFVQGAENKECDLVFVALPTPSDFSLARLYSKEFYSNFSRILKNRGLGVIQSVGYFSPVHQMVLKTLEAAGLFALPFHPPADFFPPQKPYAFGFVIFSKEPIFAGEFDEKKIAVETKILHDGNLKTIFEPSKFLKIPEKPVEVLSIFNPRAYYDAAQLFTSKLYNNF